MKLFHSFPRPRRADAVTHVGRRVGADYTAEKVLRSILKRGILCSPEKLQIYPDKNTCNPRKQRLLIDQLPELTHLQSRFCLTLCSEHELYEPKIRGVIPRGSGPTSVDGPLLSHADLFGPCAISFYPSSARHIGILPTTYYSPTDVFGNYFLGGYGDVPGLNLQIIQRLKEIRELMIVLATIERSLTINDFIFPSQEILDALKLNLPYQEEVMSAAYRLTEEQRSEILTLFNTDREIALNLVSFVDMMLSLFQQTDSSLDGSMLAFYQQREWRLIHHMRHGMVWYCLGKQPEFRNPLAHDRHREIGDLRDEIQLISGRHFEESYFDHCWVLESVDNVRVLDFISTVVVPQRMCATVVQMLKEFSSTAEVMMAEDFGYRD